MRQLTHASLFSGIGAPEVAAALLDIKNVFHCEINPFGRHILDYWFPDSVSYEDITKTDFTEWRGKIDILTGGFPCQPFSYAGKRGGREDERYLWPQMLRAINEARPTWVVGENVAGITTMVEGGILTDLGGEEAMFSEGDGIHRYELVQSFTIERICRDLESLGYSVQPMLIPAAAVGAPHRRDRVFILAHDDADSTGSGCTAQEEGRGAEGKGSDGHVLSSERGFPAKWLDGLHKLYGVIADSHNNTEGGEPGEHEGESRAQGLQEWDKVQLAGESADVRQEGSASPSDSQCSGLEHGMDTGAETSLFGQESRGGEDSLSQQVQCPEADGIRRSPSDTDSHRGNEVHEHLQPGQPDGTEPLSDGRQRNASDIKGQQGSDRELLLGLLPENRWRCFPTVSPVHRGNDGIPFDVDGLTVPPIPAPPTYGKGNPKKYPFSKWRTESLKAYGNAIVVQVMYRILQSIQEVEYGTGF